MEYECNVKIPELNTVIYMQEGSGCNMTAQDYAEGYEGYIDYEILQGKNAGDGGIFMFKGSLEWKKAIPDTIMCALDLDKCPKYSLEEVA